MVYIPFSFFAFFQLCLLGLAAYFGLFLYRRTGLCSVIWLALYLGLSYSINYFNNYLTKGWMSLLPEALHGGQNLPWGHLSMAEFITAFTYLSAIPQSIAVLLVATLLIADSVHYLQRQGLDTSFFTRFLAVHRRHYLWGAAMLGLLCLSPLAHITMAHYLSSVSSPITESYPKDLFPPE